jgi:hypothetical protein
MDNKLLLVFLLVGLLVYLSKNIETFVSIPAGMISKEDLPLDLCDNLFKVAVTDEEDDVNYISRENLIKATHQYCAYTRAVGSTLAGALLTLCLPLDGDAGPKHFAVSCCCIDAFCSIMYGDIYYYVEFKGRYYLAKQQGDGYIIVQYIEECTPTTYITSNGVNADTGLPSNVNLKKLKGICKLR